MEKEQTKDDKLKNTVRKKYNEISKQPSDVNASSCCGAGDTSNEVYNIMTDDYSTVEGYEKKADLGLGCGLPTEFAHIQQGNTVIDLGSGAGNDCFIARHETGAEGKIIGIDFTESMIAKARKNVNKLDFNNVEFRCGDIEDMPVADSIADVIVSNCVLNLVPNKQKVFSQIYRVLKPGGHFSISDIVLVGELPKALKEDAEMYAGCVAGAIQRDTYLGYAKERGFEHISIQKEKPITIPDDILDNYLSEDEINEFNNGSTGIYSITLFAQKPAADNCQLNFKPPKNEENSDQCCNSSTGCC